MTFQISSAILDLSSEGPGHVSSPAHPFLCVVKALKMHPVWAEGQGGVGAGLRRPAEALTKPRATASLPREVRSPAPGWPPSTPALHGCHGNPASLHRAHTPAGRDAERKEGCLIGRGEGAGHWRGRTRGGPAAGLADLKGRCASHMACPAQAEAGAMPGDETMTGEDSQDRGRMPLSFWQSTAASLQG